MIPVIDLQTVSQGAKQEDARASLNVPLSDPVCVDSEKVRIPQGIQAFLGSSSTALGAKSSSYAWSNSICDLSDLDLDRSGILRRFASHFRNRTAINGRCVTWLWNSQQEHDKEPLNLAGILWVSCQNCVQWPFVGNECLSWTC